jgi:hypothetical protein
MAVAGPNRMSYLFVPLHTDASAPIRRLVIPQHNGPVDRHDAVVLPFLADHCHPLLGRLLRASV